MEKLEISWTKYLADCDKLADMVARHYIDEEHKQNVKVFGIPRGGMIPAAIIAHKLDCKLIFDATAADVIVDDLIDSGKTQKQYSSCRGAFFCIYDKRRSGEMFEHAVERLPFNRWVVFPYETKQSTLRKPGSIVIEEKDIRRILPT